MNTLQPPDAVVWKRAVSELYNLCLATSKVMGPTPADFVFKLRGYTRLLEKLLGLDPEPAPSVVSCVYCGHQYPDGTPAFKAEELTAHIKVCEKHPMREVEMQNQAMGEALRECADWMRKEQAFQGDAGQCLQLDAALESAEAALFLWEPTQPKEEEEPPEKADKVFMVIDRINFDGKWAEIWTGGCDHWTHSCKRDRLDGMIVTANLCERVWNQGYAGLEVEWLRIGHNLEPMNVRLPRHETEDLA